MSYDAAIEAGVQSIYRFIQRTVERQGQEHCWVTIDYTNRPQREISVFNGVGGIPFFLSDYFVRFQEPQALDLARGGIAWCRAWSGKCHQRGLHFGKTGAALAALHLSSVRGESAVPAFSLENADVILAEPPGPVTDVLGGEASNGLYLLKLWARSGDARHLAGAVRCGDWLERQMMRDERGTVCYINPSGTMDFPKEIYLGAAHGLAGIAHYLALLAEATGNERWSSLAAELFDTLSKHARESHGGLNWPGRIGGPELNRCQWSHGAPGIGLAFLTGYRVLGDRRYLEIALQAAEATWQYGDFRSNYTQCTGLAGGGELLLEAYRATHDPKWRDRACVFAQSCLAYAEPTPEGEAWPTDVRGLHSADFMYGAAGAGHFLLRVLADGEVAMPCW